MEHSALCVSGARVDTKHLVQPHSSWMRWAIAQSFPDEDSELRDGGLAQGHMATQMAEQGFELRTMGSHPEGFPSHHRLLALQRPPSPSLSPHPPAGSGPQPHSVTQWERQGYLGAASDQCLAIVFSLAFKSVTSRGLGVHRCRVATPREQDPARWLGPTPFNAGQRERQWGQGLRNLPEAFC